MSENTLLNPDSYNLNNGKTILLYQEFLIVAPDAFKSKQTIINGDVNIDSLEQDQEVQAETGMNIIKFKSIKGVHANITQDTRVLLVVKHFETGKLVNRSLSFKTVGEKDLFVSKLFHYIKNDFTYNEFKTPLMESIHTPLKMLYYLLSMCIIILMPVLYIEFSNPKRIPVVLVPIVLFVENMGYSPIFKLMGIITLLCGLWAIKRFVTRTNKLVIKKKD